MQIVAAISDEFEKGIVGLSNSIELTGDNARDGQLGG
jgi:hypothetical protein